MNVAFQGETGAFSEEALSILCPDAVAHACATFETVFQRVSDNTVDHGVIPIENSLHGSVHQNYDLLREFDLIISGELHLRIRHNLLGLHGSSLDVIKRVFSHPQALGQCRTFLKEKLPDAELIPAYDTAGAAKMVADAGDSESVAIASHRAASEYGLAVLSESIESNHRNYTRFLKLSRPSGEATSSAALSKDIKTSVVYAQHENVPGSLFKSLAVFALRDIDLFKIESRPLVGSPGKYLFYLDLGGSVEEERVKNALHHLEEVAVSVQVLGSYAIGEQID